MQLKPVMLSISVFFFFYFIYSFFTFTCRPAKITATAPSPSPSRCMARWRGDGLVPLRIGATHWTAAVSACVYHLTLDAGGVFACLAGGRCCLSWNAPPIAQCQCDAGGWTPRWMGGLLISPFGVVVFQLFVVAGCGLLQLSIRFYWIHTGTLPTFWGVSITLPSYHHLLPASLGGRTQSYLFHPSNFFAPSHIVHWWLAFIHIPFSTSGS